MDDTGSKPAGAGATGQAAIAHGQRVAGESDIIHDSDQLTRVRFRQPIDHALSAEGPAVHAAQRLEPEAAPIGDVGALADGPSVWEALPEDEVDASPARPKRLQTGSREMGEAAFPIIVSNSAEGWIVQVGVEDLRRFGSVADARDYAAEALVSAAFSGGARRILDLTRSAGSDELLEDGQEEVFARSEVEEGAIEHGVVAGGAA